MIMSASKNLITAAAAAILTTLVCSLPTDNSNEKVPRNLTLNEVFHQTVCPIRVEYDVKVDRVPRVIKMLKCAAEPDHCNESGQPSHDCCTHKNDNYYMECVEIKDYVLVGIRTNEKELKNTTQEVAVGCSCMFQNITKSGNAEHPLQITILSTPNIS